MSEKENYLKGKSNSVFPTSVDPILFIQDININNKEYRQEYANNLASHPAFAATMLEANEYYTPISACLINNLVNRIYALQDYLLNGTNKKKTIEASKEEPTQLCDGKIWYYIEE